MSLPRCVERLLLARERISSMFVDREWQVDAALASLVSGLPALMIGDPGLGKTALVEAVARSVRGARYFYIQLSEYTEPDELLGPVDVVALMHDRVFRRSMENYLPGADIAFIDEVFRSSSAVRNMLLDILLNRRVRDGARVVRLDNLLTVYTATNFVSRDPEDWAFLDRLVIKAFFKPVPRDAVPELIAKGVELELGAAQEPVLERRDVLEARELSRRIARAAAGDPQLLGRLRDAFSAIEGSGIAVTDRTKVKVVFLAAALSVVRGSPTLVLDDVADALIMAVPRDEDELERVMRVAESLDLYSGAQVAAEVRRVRKRLKQLLDTAPNLSVAEAEELKALVAKAKALAQSPATRRRSSLRREVEEMLRLASKAAVVLAPA